MKSQKRNVKKSTQKKAVKKEAKSSVPAKPKAKLQATKEKMPQEDADRKMFEESQKKPVLAEEASKTSLMKRVRVIILGQVQSDAYQDYLQEKATMLDLTGFAQTMDDGSIEAIFEGYSDDIEEMLDYCRTGTRKTKVDDLEVIEEDYTGDFETFEIRC